MVGTESQSERATRAAQGGEAQQEEQQRDTGREEESKSKKAQLALAQRFIVHALPHACVRRIRGRCCTRGRGASSARDATLAICGSEARPHERSTPNNNSSTRPSVQQAAEKRIKYCAT